MTRAITRFFTLKNTISYQIIVVSFFAFVLFSCKKNRSNGENSASAIHFFSGGLGDKVNKIEKTADGGFLYCGYTGADSTNIDAFILKVGADGKKQWYKTYGGDGYDAFEHAIQLSDGSIIAAGSTNTIGKGSTDGTNSLFDYVVKTDANGNKLWEKSYNQSYPSTVTCCAETSDMEIILGGNSFFIDRNILLMRINAAGDLQWNSSILNPGNAQPMLVKTTRDEFLRSIQITNDGNILGAGVMSKSNQAGDEKSLVTFLLKADSKNGKINFLIPYYNFTRESGYVSAYSFPARFPEVKTIELSDGYLIGTDLELNTNKINMQLMRTDISGNILWENKYAGLGNALFYNMMRNADGSIIMVGGSSATDMNFNFPEAFYNLRTMMLGVDATGKYLWTNYTGGLTDANVLKCIQAGKTGDFTYTCAGFNCTSETGYDRYFLIQTDDKGNIKKINSQE